MSTSGADAVRWVRCGCDASCGTVTRYATAARGGFRGTGAVAGLLSN